VDDTSQVLWAPTNKENENLKGVGRMESLDYILKLENVSKSEEEKNTLAYDKSQHHKSL